MHPRALPPRTTRGPNQKSMVNPYAPPIAAPAAHRVGPTSSVPSVLMVTIVGLVVPGLPTILMRRRLVGICLLLAIPLSFMFFGPIWGLVLFHGTTYSEYGLYPFLTVLFATPLISIAQGLHLRGQLLRAESPQHSEPPRFH